MGRGRVTFQFLMLNLESVGVFKQKRTKKCGSGAQGRQQPVKQRWVLDEVSQRGYRGGGVKKGSNTERWGSLSIIQVQTEQKAQEAEEWTEMCHERQEWSFKGSSHPQY